MNKIQSSHLQRNAYVYLRQSTLHQVQNNRESTERQYALGDKAKSMGWAPSQTHILDADLGQSGSSSDNREDFKKLMTNVMMNYAGAIFAIEASRLSRLGSDWHRLLEACAITDTLIIDEDGCYNPTDFNDRMLLGLKGTMSNAELHYIRARMEGGRLHKAQKGELKIPVPPGYFHSREGRIILDPDIEVQHSLKLLFTLFTQLGSARGVAKEFAKQRLKFPRRLYGGIRAGELEWGPLTTNRVNYVLKNPSYGGAYVFSRCIKVKTMLPDGKVKRKYKIRPLSECKVLIHDHHVGYITWEEYLKNQKTLEMNRSISTGNILHSAQREGCALLQGLVLCSRCGKTLRTRYKGNNGSYPTYECNRAPREDSTITYCGSLSAQAVDDIVIKRVLEILESDQLEITLSALEELEKRNAAIEKQWQMRIQRVSYEAQLAERRYKQVDPANRLVAGTLEQDWNNCLTQLEQIQKEHESFQKKEALTVTKEQREKILKLGTDLPKLWKAESTKYKDKKRILQLLIKDVTVERIGNELKLHIRWQGGIDETIETTLINRRGRHSCSPEFIEEIRRLAELMTDEEIVDKFNNENRLSQKKKPYTVSAITWIRRKYKITSVHLRRQGELSIKEVAKKLNVQPSAVYYWLKKGYIKSRKGVKDYWILLTPELEKSLKNRIEKSAKLKAK